MGKLVDVDEVKEALDVAIKAIEDSKIDEGLRSCQS